LRTFLDLGFNEDETGNQVFEGMHPHIGSVCTLNIAVLIRWLEPISTGEWRDLAFFARPVHKAGEEYLTGLARALEELNSPVELRSNSKHRLAWLDVEFSQEDLAHEWPHAGCEVEGDAVKQEANTGLSADLGGWSSQAGLFGKTQSSSVGPGTALMVSKPGFGIDGERSDLLQRTGLGDRKAAIFRTRHEGPRARGAGRNDAWALEETGPALRSEEIIEKLAGIRRPKTTAADLPISGSQLF
jgi:hypothetical protein